MAQPLTYNYNSVAQEVVCAPDAISGLPGVLDRAGVKRAMVVCGPSILEKSNVVDRVKAALGERWTFRVLVLPGVPLVGTGPYRYVSHPNYLAVVGELVGMAALMGATWSALPVWAGFGWLLARRIRVEERALGAASVAGCRQV